MSIDTDSLKALIQIELARLSDARIAAHIRERLVEPSSVMRRWDYGDEGDEYPCWTVFSHATSNTGIAYCEYGFGPRSPWGLVSLEGDEQTLSMGMDSGWFTTFLQAFFDSQAATELSIWRVLKNEANSDQSYWVTEEADWNTTWAKAMGFRDSDLSSGYEVRTSIPYEKE